MKRNKTLSLILSLLLLLGGLLLPAAAEEPPVADIVPVAEYTSADEHVTALRVTFSPDTRTQSFSGLVALPEGGTLTVGDLVNGTVDGGDYFAICNDLGEVIGTYDGDSLAGRTLEIPGGAFRVYYISSGGDADYTIAVDDVVPVTPVNRFRVTYHLSLPGLMDISRTYDPAAQPAALSGVSLANVSYKDLALAGWAAEEGGAAVLNPGEAFPEGQTDTELWAVWVPVLLSKEETFSFNNYYEYFINDERGEKYYMSKEDYRRLQTNVLLTLGVGAQPAAVYAAVIAYDANQEWGGSCYGLALTVALQHYGIVDMLSLQNAARVNDLQPDDKLISFINYYHVLQKTDWFVENKAHVDTPAMYRTLLKDMCDELRAGKLVLFSYYPGSMYIKDGHTVLLAGIYDDTEGNHVLVAYNPNDPWDFSDGNYRSLYTVSADYSGVTCNNGDEIKDVKWTSDFDQYRSFDYTGKKDFRSWYTVFYAHILSLFRAFFRALTSIC